MQTKRSEHIYENGRKLFVILQLFSPEQPHLDVLLLGGDDALPHEEAVVLKELAVLLWLLLALVQQEADHPLLQNVTELPAARGDVVKKLFG